MPPPSSVIELRIARQWKEESWVWVDRFEMYARYHAYQCKQAKEYVDDVLATSKTMRD